MQCLFRLTAAPFLIKMGLGRPFWVSLLFYPAPSSPFPPPPPHTGTFICTYHRHSYMCMLTHTYAQWSHWHTLHLHAQSHYFIHSHQHPLTHSYTGTPKHIHTTTSSRTGTQSHMKPSSHTLTASASLTHTLNYNLSWTQSHICIKLQSVTHALFTHSYNQKFRDNLTSHESMPMWLVIYSPSKFFV